MSQPVWKCVAQLGDVNPLDHGGYWIFVDETGVYAPEAEWLEVPDIDDAGGLNVRRAYRFILEPCTFQNEILSDNPYHPDYPVWFANRLDQLANFAGMEVPELIALFCAENPLERAEAWRVVGSYFGFHELDNYPLELRRRETRQRYSDPRYDESPAPSSAPVK